MYTVNEEVATTQTQTYINTGISEVELSHRAATSPNGNAFLEYTYTNELGQTVKRTEWEVRKPLPFNEMTERAQQFFTDKAKQFTEWDRDGKVYTPEEAVQRQYELDVEAQKKRIIYVAKLFVEVDKLFGQFNNFQEFTQHVSNVIGDNCKDVKLRVKFEYARDGYVNTPQHTKTSEPWIERVDEVPADKSQIKILSTDRMEREAGRNGVQAPNKNNPLEDDSSTTTPSREKEDLPF